MEWESLTGAQFDNFQTMMYYPNAEYKAYGRLVTSTNSGGLTNRTQFSKSENFQKGTKWDKTHYKPFKNEKQWDTWNRGFKSTAWTHALQHILDGTYTPMNMEDIALFEVEQAFMYDVLQDCLLTDKGKSLVRKY